MSPVAVKCPTCGRELDWQSAPFRPFCSERCRLVDLGAWLSEQRAIPGDSAAALPDQPAEAQEKGPPKG